PVATGGDERVAPRLVHGIAGGLVGVAELAEHHRLVQLARVAHVLGDPTGTPVGGLAPAVRVQVVGEHVDRGQRGERERVHTLAAVGGPVRAARVGAVEALVADADQVVPVDRLDVAGHLAGPGGQRGGGARGGLRVPPGALA